MNYDDIFLFIKLIQIGTFSGLAKSLNMTQSTVSKRIQKLEGDLNLQLIQRNSRNFEITEDGRLLYDKFHAHQSNLNASLEDIINKQNIAKGSLHISVPKIINDRILAPYLHEFYIQHPSSELIISYNAKINDLLKEGFNLAISTQKPSSLNAKIKLLKKSHFKLFASKTYAERYGLPTQLSELKNYPMIGRSINTVPLKEIQVTHIESEQDEMLYHNSPIYINNSIDNIEMARSGHFIINIPEVFITHDLIQGSFVPVLPEYSFGDINFYLIRNNSIHSKLEKVFTDFIDSCFSKV